MNKKLVNELADVVDNCNVAIASELEKYEMSTSTPGDISARYWLSTFLDPLNKKELKSIVDSFLVQFMDEEQAKKIIKFLLIRFPDYYKHLNGETPAPTPEPEPVGIPDDFFTSPVEEPKAEEPAKEEPAKEEPKAEEIKPVEEQKAQSSLYTTLTATIIPIDDKFIPEISCSETGKSVKFEAKDSKEEAETFLESKLNSYKSFW